MPGERQYSLAFEKGGYKHPEDIDVPNEDEERRSIIEEGEVNRGSEAPEPASVKRGLIGETRRLREIKEVKSGQDYICRKPKRATAAGGLKYNGMFIDIDPGDTAHCDRLEARGHRVVFTVTRKTGEEVCLKGGIKKFFLPLSEFIERFQEEEIILPINPRR